MRCIYEDTEGNLWVGMNSGLNRLRNDLFSMYGESEGLPSDEPTTVYQDHRGRVWVGFHDSGLVQLVDGKPARVYTQKDGLPSNEIFSIRENRDGDLLIAARGGPSRLHDGYFVNPVMNDPLNRRVAFDFLQDRSGKLWVASPAGVSELEGNRSRIVIPGRIAAQQRCRGVVRNARWQPVGRHLRRGSVAAQQGSIGTAAPLHRRRRSVEQSDSLAGGRHGRHAVDRHFRRRPGRDARRPILPRHRSRWAVERQRFAHRG